MWAPALELAMVSSGGQQWGSIVPTQWIMTHVDCQLDCSLGAVQQSTCGSLLVDDKLSCDAGFKYCGDDTLKPNIFKTDCCVVSISIQVVH